MDAVLPIDEPEVVERVRSGLPLVDRIARRVSRLIGPWLELDELVSAGREGLLEAARRYNPELGVPFAAFARKRIRGAMLDTARRMAGLPRRAYERVAALQAAAVAAEDGLEARAAGTHRADGGAERYVIDRLARLATAQCIVLARYAQENASSQTPEAALEQAQLLKIVRAELPRIPPDAAELIRRHLLDGESLEDIARSMRITGSWAGRQLARALAKLSRRVQKNL